jgi:gas vesicle protein
METGKIVLGTLAGIAIGAVVGVLMAPDKGSETRKKLSKKGSELTGGLKDKYASLKDKYNSALDGATDKLESLAQKGDDLASNAKSTATPSTR